MGDHFGTGYNSAMRLYEAAIAILMPASIPAHGASFTFITFDYPAGPPISVATIANNINAQAQIVGSFSTTGLYKQGYLRNANGTFTPIVLPFPTASDPAYGI